MLRVTILFISKRMGEIGGLKRAKVRCPEGKNVLQSKLGRIFWWVMSSMVRHGCMI